MVGNDVGLKVILSNNDVKCGTDLRIHPDGEEYEETSGYVG